MGLLTVGQNLRSEMLPPYLKEEYDMSIPWKYLNKRDATIQVLQDFTTMKQIISNFSCDYKAASEELTSRQRPSISEKPNAINPKAVEAKLIRCMDQIDVITQKHDYALAFMAWFVPAWECLSENEQLILSTFFFDARASKTEIVQELCSQFHVERTAIYNRKDKALERFSLLLYGK